MYLEKQAELIKLLDGSVELKDSKITVIDDIKLRGSIEKLVKMAVLSEDEVEKYVARYLVRLVAAEAGVHPSSIHDLASIQARFTICIWPEAAVIYRTFSQCLLSICVD